MISVYLWLIGLIVFIVIEIATMGLTTIWFAGGALIALLFALADTPLVVQVLVFLVISIVLLICTRPLAVKFFNRQREKTNIDSMIGKQAIVLKEINNLKGTGMVNLGGMEWSARAYEDEAVVSEGAIVEVKEIRGVKLVVAEVEMKPFAEDCEQ